MTGEGGARFNKDEIDVHFFIIPFFKCLIQSALPES